MNVSGSLYGRHLKYISSAVVVAMMAEKTAGKFHSRLRTCSLMKLFFFTHNRSHNFVRTVFDLKLF